MNKKINLFNIIKYFIFTIFIIWILFLYSLIIFKYDEGFIGDNKEIITIISILLFTFIHFIILLFLNKDKWLLLESILSLLAFLFTVISDFMLLGYYKTYEVGLIYFIIVQLIYFIKIEISSPSLKRLIISLTLRTSMSYIILIILSILEINNILYSRVGLYISYLIINLIESLVLFIKSIKNKKPNQSRSLAFLFIGLFLFLCCDISVGVYNLFRIMGNMMWIFYVPSQVLIMYSSLILYNKSIFKEINEK